MKQEYWIGDKIRLKKSNQIGTYAGTNGKGKHRIKLSNDKIVLTNTSNIDIYEEQELPIQLIFDDEAPKPKKTFDSLRVIDLHIEILAPHLINAKAERILPYQLSSAKTFIQEAFDAGRKIVTIIHGKGEGVLRQEVEHLLRGDNRIGIISIINDGGATEVWFK